MWLLLVSLQGTAQRYSTAFRDVSKEELIWGRLEEDTTATAFVIHDIGKTYFKAYGYNLHFITERRMRIKIVKKAGFKHATIRIPFYTKKEPREMVYDIRGSTFNLEGNEIVETKLNKKDIFKKSIGNGWTTKVFTLPNVKEGSVIEIKYKYESSYKEHLENWYFQREIPTCYSAYELKLCPFYQYKALIQGYGELDRDTTYTEYYAFEYDDKSLNFSVFQWEASNVPAFREEAFITTPMDYLLMVSFQLVKVFRTDGTTHNVVTSWDKVVSRFDESDYFGEFVRSASRKVQEVYVSSGVQVLSREKRLKAIVDYVKQNYTWNGNNGAFATKSMRKLLEEKTGNVADINLLTVALLQKAGIESYPMLLSTRSHGKILHDFPASSAFNYAIAYAKLDSTRQFLLDATAELLPYNLLPENCLNGYALRVKKKDQPLWYPLIAQDETYKKTNLFLSLDTTTNQLKGGYRNKLKGYMAEDLVDNWITSDQNEEALATLIDPQSRLIEVIEPNIKHQLLDEQPAVVSAKLTAGIERIGEEVIFAPLLHEAYSTNPLKSEMRIYPLEEGYTYSIQTTVSFQIPKGYKVKSYPSSFYTEIENLGGQFKFDVTYQEGFSIQINSFYSFDKTVYPPEMYKQVRNFIDRIIQKHSEVIVLEKGT